MSLLLRVCALMFVLAGAFVVSAAERAQAVIDESKMRCNSGDWIGALDGLLAYIDSDSGDATPTQEAELYMLTGYLYSDFADYVTAIKYYDAALEVCRAAGLRHSANRAAANAAMSAACLRNRTQAARYLEYVRRGIGDTASAYDRFMLRIVEGSCERYFGDTRRGADIMRECLAKTRNGSIQPQYAINALSELADIYIQTGPVDSARHYLRLIDRETARYHHPHVEVANLRYYMDLYGRLGMPDSALIYQQRYFGMRDSLLNHDRFMAMTSRYAAAREERGRVRIQGLTSVVGYQSTALVLAIAVIAILAVGLTVLTVQKRRLNQAYRALWDKNKEVSQLETATRIRSTELPSTVPLSEELGHRIAAVMEGSQIWTDPDFSLQSLADAVGSNTKYVSAFINDVHGVNFRTFINDYRIREARRRITDPATVGQYSLQAIGESVGFKSATNFIAAFRRQTGLTPSIYLKMWQQEQQNS